MNVGALLHQVSWPECRHHPWRTLAAWLSVVLGVALAYSVHLINASALGEFSAAVRQVSGQPDFELRAQRGGFDEALYARVATHPAVASASPVVEVDTYLVVPGGARRPLRVLGIDALQVAATAPALLPRPDDAAGRFAIVDPGTAFLNPAARAALAGAGRVAGAEAGHKPGAKTGHDAGTITVQAGARTLTLAVRGSVAAEGPPLAVMDIAGAQATFDVLGRLSRIDVRLAEGADRAALLAELALPPGVRAASPDEAGLRVSNLSRAYRVNLTVLALVALFTGAFLVFSILALSVARRLPQFALLGVLGLAARDRLKLVLAESALLGAAGSLAGLALGAALAATALRLLGGDLGGGAFAGLAPPLQIDAGSAAVYGLLGIAAAVVGGWVPARHAQRIAPARVLKGLGDGGVAHGAWALWGPMLLALGGALTFAPPVAGLPLAAYVSVACLLVGGIACVPAAVALLLRWTRPPRRPLALLAVERARHERDAATIVVAGVVASLALAVALTVMVASFRDSVTRWLDDVLPADLYARSAANSAAAQAVFLPSGLPDAARALPGVARVEASRAASVQIDPTRPPVSLLARAIGDAERTLPLTGRLVSAEPGRVSAYVSETFAGLYGVRAGTTLALPLPDGRTEPAHVRGVWRDYARQHGAVLIDAADFERLTGDTRRNDLAIWLRAGADAARVQQQLRELAGDGAMLEFATTAQLRETSLRIFDRSFAVTYWLQAVAIVIGLFGIAASGSAQVLARRREFGLLAHLGLTRRQVLALVAAEGAVWTAAGALLGLALGLLVSVVLVEVVNPQSFHWTMDLAVPWGRLALLGGAVLLAGTATAWLSARGAASCRLALAVKEDW